ncbi:hypothetical protein H5410_013128 [Solanum commersonii]|uniref:Uncharacterized protein n=1 Tax=Solanum commersonii TaxID=4109 RepID=A0A9J6ATN1_SOLCO|nr:hypothetical protein H5410_013128 [Solanum commersonii]
MNTIIYCYNIRMYFAHRILTSFVKHMTEVAETVLLKGHCGKNWNLKLQEDENGTFFHGAY